VLAIPFCSGCLLLLNFSLFGAKARAGHLEDEGMMDQPIDGRGRGYGILAEPIPLTEDEIAADQHAVAFLAFGQESKEHLHLGAALLQVADIIDDDSRKAIEFMKLLFQA
jgi:hypothetical protein